MLKLILLSQDSVNSFKENAQILATDSLKKLPIATQNPLCQLLLFTAHYSLFIAYLIHILPPIFHIMLPEDQVHIVPATVKSIDFFDQCGPLESL